MTCGGLGQMRASKYGCPICTAEVLKSVLAYLLLRAVYVPSACLSRVIFLFFL